MTQMSERDKTCWCTHSGHDHDAGECWAEVTTTEGTGQCGCNWWEPVATIHYYPAMTDPQAIAELGPTQCRAIDCGGLLTPDQPWVDHNGLPEHRACHDQKCRSTVR